MSIYDAIDLFCRRLRKLTESYTPSFLQSKGGLEGNTKFHHDPQTGRLDASRDSLWLPAAKNRYHSYVGTITPLFAVPTPAHARPVYTHGFFDALSRYRPRHTYRDSRRRRTRDARLRQRGRSLIPPLIVLLDAVVLRCVEKK